jgi:hypothetical protein
VTAVCVVVRRGGRSWLGAGVLDVSIGAVASIVLQSRWVWFDWLGVVIQWVSVAWCDIVSVGTVSRQAGYARVIFSLSLFDFSFDHSVVRARVQVQHSRESILRVIGVKVYDHKWSSSVSDGIFAGIRVSCQIDREVEDGSMVWSFIR